MLIAILKLFTFTCRTDCSLSLNRKQGNIVFIAARCEELVNLLSHLLPIDKVKLNFNLIKD